MPAEVQSMGNRCLTAEKILRATAWEVLAVGLCFLPSAARADWITYQGDVAHTGYVPGSYNFTNAAVQWQTTVPATLPVNGLAVGGSTVLATNREYFSGYPTFHALDQASGAIL